MEELGEFLELDDLLEELAANDVGLISSAGDNMICRFCMVEAASASTLADTSLSGDALSLEWELPWTNCDCKIFKIKNSICGTLLESNHETYVLQKNLIYVIVTRAILSSTHK